MSQNKEKSKDKTSKNNKYKNAMIFYSQNPKPQVINFKKLFFFNVSIYIEIL